MRTALYPGTFDPPTLGHVDVIRRSTTICDKLYVGIAINSAKADDLFTIEERQAMLKTICKPFPHVEVVTFETLVVEFAKKNKVDFLLRGLRAFSDAGSKPFSSWLMNGSDTSVPRSSGSSAALKAASPSSSPPILKTRSSNGCPNNLSDFYIKFIALSSPLKNLGENMASLIQTGLDLVVNNANLPAWVQDTASKFTATAVTCFHPLEQRAVTFERHPLHTLHHLLQRALVGQHVPDIGNRLQAVPDSLRNAIYQEVWEVATDPEKGGDRWGENNALNDLPRLLHTVKRVVEKRLDTVPQEKKDPIFGTIYRMANLPSTGDYQWGEHHANEDTERLIRALHRHECLDISAAQVSCYTVIEQQAPILSQPFHLYRPELTRGQICLINGMSTTFADAKEKALKLSNDSAQGINIHCVYSASGQTHLDAASAFLGQGGAVTPPVVHLLDQWQDFFEAHDNDRLMQICTSRGAIEVKNALSLLPPALRQRIIVIAIAPAYLIPRELAYKVVHLLIPVDPVVQVAGNRDLMNAEHVIKLSGHSDTVNPHDMNGSSYRDWIQPRINTYIHTNDIEL
jgi:cytidyltransferase-like protein